LYFCLNHHRLGNLNIYFPYFWVLEVQDQGMTDPLSVEGHILVCKWLPPCCDLTYQRELINVLLGHYPHPGLPPSLPHPNTYHVVS
jgi:hypothetical protein